MLDAILPMLFINRAARTGIADGRSRALTPFRAENRLEPVISDGHCIVGFEEGDGKPEAVCRRYDFSDSALRPRTGVGSRVDAFV